MPAELGNFMNWNWPKLQVSLAEQTDHWSVAKRLFQEYADSLDIDMAFEGFDEEMANFPGEYATDAGCVLLANEGENVVGCVALGRLEDEVCEMKHLYVVPDAQGRGIGRALVHRLIKEAKDLGYKRMKLDIVPSMRSARRLYIAFGFREIESYRHSPIEGTTFMELTLVY